MSKKMVAPLILCPMLLLSACGGTNNTPAATEKVTPVEVKKDPVTLTVYFQYPNDWPEEEFMKTFAEPLMKKYPHMTIKYIPGGKLSELIAAGGQIDIVFASIGKVAESLMDYKLETDITAMMKKNNYNTNHLDQTMVDAAKQIAGGGMYGLPVYTMPQAIYYNKDLFDKFGVPYPKDGLSWDQVYELSKSLTRNEGGVQYYGFGTSYGHLAMLNQQSIPIVYTDTKRSTFDKDEKWRSFADNLIRFYKLPGYDKVDPGKISEPNERNRFFKDRTMAMFLGISAQYQAQEIGNMNWDLASAPTLKEAPGLGLQPYPVYFYVASTSKYKDQAFDAISYLTTPEYQIQQIKDGKFVTALSDNEIRKQFGSNNPLYTGKNVKALQPSKYAPVASVNKYNGPNNGEMVTIVRDVVYNGKDINTALREAAERVNKKIDTAEAASK